MLLGEKMERLIAVCLVVSEVCVTLIVSEQPSCLNKISDVTAMVGRTAFLPCQLQGNPLPTYEWRKVQDQTLRLLGSRFTPSDKGLIIHEVTKEDGGKYQVKLENKLFYHSAIKIKLHVKDNDFINRAKFKSVIENSSVSLSCGKRPTRTSSNIKWFDSTGTDVSNLNRYNIHNNGSLIISPVKMFDTGQYTCKNTTKMDGGYLEESLEWYMDVKYETRIIIIKQLVEVLQNATILLPCTSIGNPAPTNQWLFPNGSVIRNKDQFKTFDNGSVLIFNVQMENNLDYKCVSSNGIGRPIDAHTRLFVLVPPRFLTHPDKNILVDEGDEVVLDCTSSGIPKPDTTWEYLNGSIEVYRQMYFIENVATSHAGIYTCLLQSKAGRLNRTFVITVKGKPAIPTSFSVKVISSRLLFKWSRDRNGGFDQTFELWYRSDMKTDYEWKSISANDTSYNTSSEDIIGESKVIYCSVRARNSKGYSGFSQLIQLSYSPTRTLHKLLKKVSDTPLAPYNFTVNISEVGYMLRWKYMITPGRPNAKSFVVEYCELKNVTVWKAFSRNNRTRRSLSNTPVGELNEIFIPGETIYGIIQPVQFRVYAVAFNGRKSEASITPVKRDTPFVGGSVSSNRSQTDIIPPIVLGVIFLFFFVILVVSLYCFCRRKMKRAQAQNAEKKDEGKSDLILETYSLEFDDESKLFASKPHSSTDSPTLFHLATCPALTLGKCSKKNRDLGGSDEVYFLLEANEKEITTCTCNKGVKIKDSVHEEHKKIEYKTSSSPTVTLTSEGDASSVVPSEGFDDDEDYEVSDVEKDCVAELDKVRAQVMKRFKFKDSYDQFCRPVVNDTPRTHISTIEKTEVDSNMETNTADDDSSENSATESERRLKSMGTNDHNCNPKLFDKKPNSEIEECTSSSSDPDSISFLNSHNTTEHSRVYNPLHSKRDTGYYSDNPSRISPLFVTNQHFATLRPSQKPHIPSPQYYSDDNASNAFRMKHPPTYNQAIIDIERMSDRNEIADSEEMYDHLLRMEKQLGVQLTDSLDSELNASTLPSNYRHPHSKNSSDTGYISDIQLGTSRDRYSHREKSVRCAQLLNEFKGSKPEDLQLMGETSDSSKVTCNSVLDDMVAELPKMAPILKRANSISSNSTHNEWLV